MSHLWCSALLSVLSPAPHLDSLTCLGNILIPRPRLPSILPVISNLRATIGTFFLVSIYRVFLNVYLYFQRLLVDGKDSAAAYLHKGMIAARTLMLESIRPSTASRYRQAYSRWENFCKAADVSPLPAQPDHLSACLAVVASETHSVSAVEAIYAAVAHRHKLEGYEPPTQNPALCLLLRSIRRKFGKPRCQVKPITDAMLRQMIDYLRLADSATDVR